MAEIVVCPNCQCQLQVSHLSLGKIVQCPKCQHQFEATSLSAAVQSAVPAPITVFPKPAPEDREDSDEPRPRRRRFEDDDDDDYDDDDFHPRIRRRHLPAHRGSLIMTLGILSIFVAPLILGTIAWVLGSADLRAMQEGQMDPEGESQTRTGRNIGRFMVCLYLVVIVVAFAFMGIMIATDNMR